jgi:hypothetical protein
MVLALIGAISDMPFSLGCECGSHHPGQQLVRSDGSKVFAASLAAIADFSFSLILLSKIKVFLQRIYQNGLKFGKGAWPFKKGCS